MMFQEATFKLAYIKEVQAQVLELPYVGEELSMIDPEPGGKAESSQFHERNKASFIAHHRAR